MKVNGREVNITVGSFSEVMALKRAVAAAFSKGGVKLDLSGFNLGKSLEETEVGDISGLVNLIMTLATNKEVKDCLFKLGGRCTIGNGVETAKVTEDYFENSPENWDMYYPVMIAIAKENLTPFFKGLSGKLSNLSDLIPGLRK